MLSKGEHLVIVGCPGTGKTTSLAQLVTGYRKDIRRPVIFCSHTRAAAQAALDKNMGGDDEVQVSTLHSLAFRRLGLSRAQVAEGPRLRDFCREVGAPMGQDFGDDAGNDVGDEYMAILSIARARLEDPMATYDKSNRPGSTEHFQSFVASYAAWKGAHGYVDFSDMLERAIEHRDWGDVGLLVVDEAQDLTRLHWRTIWRIIKETGCQCVVAGDSDQAINAWSGADPMGMHKFEDVYKARREVLPQSWRVPRAIHRLAEQIIDRAAVRIQRQYAPRDVEGSYERYEGPWGIRITPDTDTLVLFADRFQRIEVEAVLMEDAVPYTAISGLPAPLDMRGGKAILAAETGDTEVVKRGLNDRGRMALDTVGIKPIIDQIVHGDYGLLSIPIKMYDYFHRVPKTESRVRISTIHGAKGLEADEVHLVTGQSPAAVAHSWIDPDASHRLMYVAVTRTRDKLFTYSSSNDYELP